MVWRKSTNDTDKFTDLPPFPSLESDEEAKEESEINILTENKLLTRLPILLAQIKAGNTSHKLKNEIGQTLYLFYLHTQFNQVIITVGVIIKDKLEIITEPKTNHFDLTKNVNNSLKYEVDLIIKHNEFSAE